MKIQEYRDLCAEVREKLSSVKSAVGSEEKMLETERLRRAVEELANAKCRTRKNERDTTQAQELIAEAMPYLGTNSLQ